MFRLKPEPTYMGSAYAGSAYVGSAFRLRARRDCARFGGLAVALAKAVRRTLRVIACLAFASLVLAQEGHPLVGTWHGTWGPTAAQRNDVTIVMEYDGKTITGLLNPGPDGVRFDKVTLEPTMWAVHFEAMPKGAKAPIVIDATLQDVTNRHRSLVGTWAQGSTKGDFKMSRDD